MKRKRKDNNWTKFMIVLISVFLITMTLAVLVPISSSSTLASGSVLEDEPLDEFNETSNSTAYTKLYEYSDYIHVDVGYMRYNFRDYGTGEILDRDNNTIVGYMRNDLQIDGGNKWNDVATEFMGYSYENYTDENGREAYRVTMNWGNIDYDSNFQIVYNLEYYQRTKIDYHYEFKDTGSYRSNWHISDIRLGNYEHKNYSSVFYEDDTDLIIDWEESLPDVENINLDRQNTKIDVYFEIGEFESGDTHYIDPSLSGSGTEADPYQITTLTELQSINDELSAHYILMNDIDASETSSWNDGKGWEPIGDDGDPFEGTFDGGGNIIENLHIDRPDEDDVGLFGRAEGSTIENIGVEDVDVNGSNFVGGLVGVYQETLVSNCYAMGDVSGNDFVGGLAGFNRNSATVQNSYARGDVSGDDYVGGLVGYGRDSSTVSNCYATGDVSGSSSFGSLVGRILNNDGDTDEILYSYANSDINPDLDLIGSTNIGGTLDTTGSSLKTTAEMTSYSTFDDGGWDITTVEPGKTDDSYTWNIVDGDTEPFLSFGENSLATEDGSKIWEHEHHEDNVMSVFERNGVVYSGSSDEKVIASDAEDGSKIWEHELHEDIVRSVFERNGVVYSASYDNKVIAADAEDGSKIWEHEHHGDWVHSVFESDGVVYSGSSDNKVIAADAEDGSKIWEHEHHGATVNSVFERNGVVYSASYDNKVIAADAEDGSKIWEHEHHGATVHSVFERNGVVYSGSSDDKVIAADAEDGSKIWEHEHHEAPVNSVFERNGVIYSGGVDNKVIAADAEDGSKIWEHEHHGDSVRSVFERNGVVYSASSDNKVIAAVSEKTDYISTIWEHELHGGAVYSVFERNETVYSGCGANKVIAADSEDGTKIWEHELHGGTVHSVFERNGVIYSGSFDNKVIAADSEDGSKIWEHEHHGDNVFSVFEQNGVVYSGSYDNKVIAADAEDGTKIWEHEHHGNYVHSVFERNETVYSGSSDNKVIAADAEDGTKIWEHEHHGGSVTSVFERNETVYSGGTDDKVIAADSENGSKIWEHTLHGGAVMSVFERNETVYSGSEDFKVIAADAEDGTKIWEHQLHGDLVHSVFERNGIVYSGGWDNKVIAAVSEKTDYIPTIWEHELHESPVQSVFERNGVVYSGSDDNKVIAADAEDGSKIWEHEHHEDDVWSVFENNGVVYSASLDEKVIAADSEDGSKIWEHELHGDAVLSVFERNGVVYSGGNKVIAADAEDGSKIWEHTLHGDAVNSVFERNGVVYSGSLANTVIAADVEDGSKIWEHEHHESWVYSVFERNGVVYSSSWDGKVIAADAEDGSKIWEHQHHGDIVFSVFERNGVVYSGGQDNKVIAADAEDGSKIWEHTLHGGSVHSVFERNGIVYSGGLDNKVIAAVSDEAEYFELNIDVEGDGLIYVDDTEVDIPYSESYSDGTEINVEAIADDGWYFEEWQGTEETGEVITITMDEDKTITAVFEIHTYELTVDTVGEGQVELDPDEEEYEHGTEVTLTASPNEGWYFEEWQGTEETGEVITITMDEDKDITAVFSELFELTVNIDGEGTVEVDGVEVEDGWTESYDEGTEVTLEASPDEGWDFIEWQGTEETGEVITITMDEDKTITAHFEIHTYELTVDTVGEGQVELEPDQETYEHGTVVELTASPDEGWYFEEWTGDYEGTDEVTTITMDEDKTITAVFAEEIVEYQLTINIEGEGSTNPSEGTHTYDEGTEVTLEASPDEGWYFIEWTGDYEGTEEVITITMDEDKTITAVFEIHTYELTVDTVGEGDVDIEPDQETYEHGTEVTLTALPDEGWYFEGWEMTLETGEVITITMDDDKTITAHFQELEPDFVITDFEVEPVEGDAPLDVVITAEIENVGDIEGTITLETDGVEINSWTIGPDESVSVDEEYTYDEAGLYYVNLGPEDITVNVDDVETHTLVVDVQGQGEVIIDPDSEEFEHGEDVTLTALPDEGWYFVDWYFEVWQGTEDYEGTDEVITITMDEDKEITAHFREIPIYELTIQIEGQGSVEIEPDREEYEHGEEVTLTASPDEGWYFIEWQGTEETGEEITIIMDEDKTITAVFAEEDDTVPEVETLSPTGVTNENATLRGEVTSMGNETSVDVFFRWRDTNTENGWNETPVETLTEAEEFNYNLTLPDENKTYEYKAVVQWNGEENTGVIRLTNPIDEAIRLFVYLIISIIPLVVIFAIVKVVFTVFGTISDDLK